MGSKDSNGGSGSGFVPDPKFTPHMVKKAGRLARNCLCAMVGGGVWQVCSSDGGSYFVTTAPDDCQCTSFKIRRACSHVLAVQMLEYEDAAGGGQGEEEEGARHAVPVPA